MRRKRFLSTIITACAAFTMALGVGINIAKSASELYADGGTYTFSDHYNANTVLDETEITLFTGVTATFNKRNGGTATQYYTNGSAVRWYGGGTLAINAGSNTLSAITLSFGGTKANAITADVGSYTDGSANGSGSWTGSASTVTFTQAGTSGHDRISSISVTYSSSGSGDPTPTPTTYTVIYNANGGTGNINDTSSPYESGSQVTVKDCTGFTAPEGKEFSHWYTTASGTDGTRYNPGDTFNIEANTILYAQWADIANTAILTVGTNGTTTQNGSTPVTWTNGALTSEAWVGSVHFVPGGTSGNNGFYYNSDTSWRFYSTGYITISIPNGYRFSSIKLYWKTGIPTTPEGLVRDGTTSPTTYTPATISTNLNSVVFARDAANFLLQKAVVSFEEVVLLNQTITASSESARENETITVSSNAESEVVWSIVDGVGTTAPGAAITSAGIVSVTGPGTVTIKASASGYNDATKQLTFTERPAGTYYTVTFNSNGGSDSPINKSVLENETFVFPSAGSKEHYTFDGWTSTGSAPYYAVGATSPAVTGNITYTAHWTEDAKYVVTYSAGANGSGSYADVDHYAGTYTLLAFNVLGITPNSGYQFKDYTVNDVHKNPGDTITISSNTTITVNFEEIGYTVTFGTADGSAGLTGFTNTSYVIPDGVTLDNIQGNVYGKNDNTSSAIRFGKSGTTGSFDVTIDSQYYIKKIIANLKYYGSDTTAKFAVTPDGEDAVEKTLTNAFANYEYDVSDAYTNKVTLGTTIDGKRAYLASFKITYGVKTALGTIEHTKTNTLLNYQYEQVNESFTYTHVGIRFGGYIAKSLFNQIDNIQSYGVICAFNSALGGKTIKQLYEEALDVAEGNIDDALYLLNDDATIRCFSSATAQPQEAADTDYYKWNLYKEIIVTGEGLTEEQVTNKLTLAYTAVAFIKTSTSIIFFKQVTVSAASIADKLIDSGSQPIDAYDGSLKHLADLLGE